MAEVTTYPLKLVKGLRVYQGTLTDTYLAVDITATWNDAAETFSLIKANVTNTNSAAASKLIDLQVGGVTQFNVTRAGVMTVTGAINASGTVSLTSGSTAISMSPSSGNPTVIWNRPANSDFNTILFRTAGASKWSNGQRGGSENWVLYDETNAVAAITVAQGAAPAVTLAGAVSGITTLAGTSATLTSFVQGSEYRVSGTKVVGAQGAALADASGGAVIDAEARAAINSLLARIRTHGLIAT